MLTIFINLFVSLALGAGLYFTHTAGVVSSILAAVALAILLQILLGLYMRRRMKQITNSIEALMAATQKRLQAKVAHWQQRPPSSPKQAQQEMERDQTAAISQALTIVDKLIPYYKWIPLLRRQADTMRMQFHWQLKHYAEVDALLPRVLFADPQLMAIKLARLYQTDAPSADIAQQFAKFTKRLRYGQGELLYGLHAWIQLQRKDLDGALKTLVDAEAKMESKVLKANREHLANNRPAHYSLVGLGDAWYALWLEEPKIRQQRINPRHAARYF